MIPVVIVFAVIALFAGGATILLPAIREKRGRSRRRRRSKGRKRTHTPRQRLHLVDPPQAPDEAREAGAEPGAADRAGS